MTSLKDMVKGTTVNFLYYQAGELWYEVSYGEDETFKFPVPINDIGDAAVFQAEDKAILFMRYIRKYMQTLENKNVA